MNRENREKDARPLDNEQAISAVIFYEMLSGRHPFGGRSAVEARDAGEKPPPIAFLTDKQNAALAKGLAFERAARTTTALMQVKAALAQDPLDPPSLYVLTEVQMRLGHLAEAEAAIRRALDIRPTLGGGHYLLGLVLLARGDRDGALVEMQREAAVSGMTGGLAIASFELGRKADSDAALARMLEEHARDNAFVIAEAYAFRGQSDAAMQWLERAYNQKDPGLYWLKVEMPQRSLAGDSRFKDFLRKMNLPE